MAGVGSGTSTGRGGGAWCSTRQWASSPVIHTTSHIAAGLFTVVSGVGPSSIFLRKILDADITSDGWVLPRGAPPRSITRRSKMEMFIPISLI